MRRLDNLIKDGYQITSHGSHELEIATISLKKALLSYFSSFKEIKNHIDILINENNSLHIKGYIDSYFESIIHFQHFFELACKHILKQVHPLMFNIASKDTLVFYKLLKNIGVSESDYENLNTIEFSETLSRLELLAKQNISELSQYIELFDTQNIKSLRKLNDLRNRLWHRGLYVLRLKTYDEFICKYILPITTQFAAKLCISETLPNNTLNNINPIAKLIESFSGTTNPDYFAINLIKEMARASYLNPLDLTNKSEIYFFESDNGAKLNEIYRTTNILANERYADITECPVCGVRSLLKMIEDTHIYDEETDSEEIETHITAINCVCCSFSVTEKMMIKDYEFLNLTPLFQ
ncbi:MAG: hypothetical protein EOM50_15700 [Erysipelotrichia bacterium]|nr:hypothetical protein [Erysipelotrichia bacterium]